MSRLIWLPLTFLGFPFFLFAQWQVVHVDTSGNNYLADIKFKNDTLGFAMGSNSTVLKTINQGNTWEQIQIGEPIDIWDFQFIGDSSIYLVGDNKLMGSNNMGGSWQTISTFNEHIYLLFFLSDTSGFVIGENGIYKTINKGSAWEAKWLFEENEYSFGEIDQIVFLNDTLGFAAATGFRNNIPSTIDVFLMKTEDAGETWDSIYTFGHNFDFLISMQFINDSSGYVCNWNGHLYKTNDLGESWVEITDTLAGVTRTFFTSTEIGYAAGAFTIYFEPDVYPFGRIYTTSNGGEDWEITETPGIPLFDLFFVNDSTGFAIGDYELILKTSSYGGPIEGDYPWDLFPPNSIEEIGIHEPMVNLFPNPFTESLQINFEERNKKVHVLILNSMGIEMYRNNFNDVENLEIDLAEILKGIYFVHILADYGQKTIRVVKK